MNFQQLRIVRETVRRNFNLTEVANTLFTSQSGVSKHIKDLEDELGVELYVRKGKRLLGLTEPGKEMVRIVERLLLEARNIRSVAEQYSHQDSGFLTIVTTHTQARYALPTVVSRFKQEYPKVHLRLHQGSPAEITQMLLDGEADIGIATEALGTVPNLITFPFYHWHHGVVVPVGHRLESAVPLTLQAIAAWPIITYHEGFTGRAKIEKAFEEHGVSPEFVMSALDADVIKAYVELGLGIGIIASVAFDPSRDHNLRLLDCSHLFEENVTRIAVRAGQLLKGYAYQFIAQCSPDLAVARIKAAVERED